LYLIKNKNGCEKTSMRKRMNNRGDNGFKKSRCEFLKRFVRIFVPLFLLLFAATMSFADIQDMDDDIKFEHLSIEQGLSQSTVFCILQDSRGFMWFGTQHGLNRYDGHTFKLYDHNPKNPNSLSHNLVISLYEDGSGMIWVGTWGGGLNRFDRETEKFEVYKNIPGYPNSLINNDVWWIYEDKDGVLWIGTGKGLNKYDRENDKFTRYLEKSTIDDRTLGNRINTIYQDSQSTLLVGADDGLFKYERDKDDFIRIKCKIGSKEPTPQKIRVIHGQNDNVLWLGTEGGLYKFILENGKIIHDHEITDKFNELRDKQVNSIHSDPSGRVWIGTQGQGLYIVDPLLERPNHYTNNLNNPDSLSHNDVRAIYEDKSGLIWIGTYNGGLNKYDPQRKKFTLYRNLPNNPNSLSNNNVMTIVEGKDGVVWIGTWGEGINKFDPANKKFSRYTIPPDVSKNTLRNDIHAVCQDPSGFLWIGTVRAGMYMFEPIKNKFTPYILEDPEKNNEYIIGPEEYIQTIYLDKEDVLWVGTQDRGLTKIEKNRKEYKNYRYAPQNHNSLSDDKVYTILEDRSGTLWIGTPGGGLNRFNREKEIFTRFQSSKGKPDSISHNFIMQIYQDREGSLWIGTNGGGLNKFDRLKETFTAFTMQDGLPDNVIYDILEDDDGCLWLSTNKGLSWFNTKIKKFRNYTVRDGLQDYEFNRGTAWKSKNGKMFFGGINGFNVFDPKEIKLKDRLSKPPIVITSFKKRSQEVKLDTSISEIDQLELSYKDTSISFEFAALSFSDPERNRYAYKLEPFDKEWIDLGNKHVVDHINLKPGQYTFRVKGSNNDGTWNEDGKSINITVNPPYWQSWWFYVLSALIIISVIFIFVRWRLRIKEKANKILKQEITERRRAEELYRSLVETSPDAITLSDVETGRIKMANRQAADLLGYSSEDEIQEEIKNIFDIFSKDDRERAKENAEKIKMSEIIINTEYTLISKDETPIAVEINTSLIRDDHGNPKYFLSITRDIRERKEAEKKERMHRKKLIQTDKMVALGTLVSGVAHELNNPVASIKMNSGNFARVWEDVVPILDSYYERNKDLKLANIPYKDAKGRLEDLIIGLLEGGQRIEKIIDDLRDFARPEDTTKREMLDINAVIKSAVDINANMIKRATKNFSFNQSKTLPNLMGNYHRLEQVFVNLIQNACQALPNDKHRITISTDYEQEKRQIIVKVKDEGVGIEEKDIEKITDPFFTTKREKGGSGLGLSISLQILQDHGGGMSFESTKEKGTTVTVNLPVTDF
jgi:PAS domain S-box-containing protein